MDFLPRDVNKYKISRRSRKITYDDHRTLTALPKDVSERTWAEIMRKEEIELMILDLREEILEEALRICYDSYLERQTPLFTIHCFAEALCRLIDAHFYVHDPGEEASSLPLCYIPKRAESWAPDPMPAPAPKDSWGSCDLQIKTDCFQEVLGDAPAATSHDLEGIAVEPIPSKYWFPGRVNLTTDYISASGELKRHITGTDRSPRPNVELRPTKDWRWNFVEKTVHVEEESETSSKFSNSSEVLERVTDYGDETGDSRHSSLKPPSPVEETVTIREPSSVKVPDKGAGDTATNGRRRASRDSRGSYKKRTSQATLKLSEKLPQVLADSETADSAISDCRLRNIRTVTHRSDLPHFVLLSPFTIADGSLRQSFRQS